MSLGPLSCDLMGWRGAGGNGSSSIGVFFFMGGLLMIIGSIGEFILGNSYPFIVFSGFGTFEKYICPPGPFPSLTGVFLPYAPFCSSLRWKIPHSMACMHDPCYTNTDV
jgi:hypothetical protein